MDLDNSFVFEDLECVSLAKVANSGIEKENLKYRGNEKNEAIKEEPGLTNEHTITVMDLEKGKKTKARECSFSGCYFKCNKGRNLWEHVKKNHGEKSKTEVMTSEQYDNQTNDEKNLIRHEGRKQSSTQVSCPLDNCDFNSKYQQALKRHFKTKHNRKSEKIISPSECSYTDCDFKSNHPQSMKRHVRTIHLGEKGLNNKIRQNLPCTFEDCGFLGRDKQDIGEHIKRVHIRDKLFSCSLCKFSTHQEYYLRKHISGQHDETHVHNCSYEGCDYTSNYSTGLKGHVKRVHLGEKTVFDCDECDYKGSTKTNVRFHFTAMHTDRRHNCPRDGCDYSSRWRTSISIHLKEGHSEGNKVQCTQCGYQTFRKRHLAKHFTAMHTNERQTCPREGCEDSFKWSAGLKAHMKRVHLGVKKTIKCEQCDYKGSSMSNVRSHFTAMHSDQINFCDNCDFSTKWGTSLNKHLKESHGEGTKLQCSECSYQTYRKTQLVKHTNAIHLNVKEEYFCDQCVFKTSKSFKLKIHIDADVHIEEIGKTVVKTEEIICKIMKRENKDGNFLQCEYCNLFASSSNDLLLHNANYHKSKSDINMCKQLNLM